MYSPYKDEVILPGQAPISNKLLSAEIKTDKDVFSVYIYIRRILLFFGSAALAGLFAAGFFLIDFRSFRTKPKLLNSSDFDYYTYPYMNSYSPVRMNYFIHKVTMDTNTDRYTVFAPTLINDISLILKHNVKFEMGSFNLYMDDNWFSSHKIVVEKLKQFADNPNFKWSGLVIALCGVYFPKEQITDYNKWLDMGVRFYNHTQDHFSKFNKKTYSYKMVRNPSIEFVLQDFSNGFKKLKYIFGDKFFLVKKGDFYYPYLQSKNYSYIVNLVIPYGDISSWKKAYIFEHGIPFEGKFLMVDKIYKAWGYFEGVRSKSAIGEDRIEYHDDMIMEKDDHLFLKVSSGKFIKAGN